MIAVSCNVCAGEFVPEIKTERRGDLEFQFFDCPYCGNPYLITVTDDELRKDIRRYLAIGERIRKGDDSEELLDESMDLLHRNVRRSNILKSMHPMEAR